MMDEQIRRTRFIAGLGMMIAATGFCMLTLDPYIRTIAGELQGIGFMVAWIHRSKS